MAHIYALDGKTISPFISDVFYTGDFEGPDENFTIIVTGEDEKDCVEFLGNLQEKYGELTYYSVIEHDDLEHMTEHAEPFEDDKASEKERKYVNSYENPEYRDYWGLNDEPDEPDPPEPDDYPDLTKREEKRATLTVSRGRGR